MRRKELLLLFFGGLLFYLGVAWFQHVPGYTDADYYFAGGLRLVRGQGFTETFLWNYLDNPQTLPHPSHAYWYPLASILAAAGMLFTGQAVFWSARLGFILVAAAVAPVTALLTYDFTANRQLSISAGLLAIFSGFYAIYLTTTDNFGLYMLLGGLFLLLLRRKGILAAFALGLVTGLLNLARVDGLIWLLIGIVGLLVYFFQTSSTARLQQRLKSPLVFLLGYLLIMGPWMARNLLIWGTPFNPAGTKMFWMTNYEQTFAWPASQINLQNWLASGWSSILSIRLDALKVNLFSAIGVQGEVLLFPFILAGLWFLRHELRIRLALLAWVILFLVMSIALPFAGPRGSYFHAGSAFQPLWFAMAVTGLDGLLTKARSSGKLSSSAPLVFRRALVVFIGFLTVFLLYQSIVNSEADQFERGFIRTEALLVQKGAQPQDVVITENPPGYYAATGRSAIVIPAADIQSMYKVAAQFGAKYLVLEKDHFPEMYTPIYQNPTGQAGLNLLAEFDGIQVYGINH